MNKIVLKDKKVNYKKLMEYGFIKKGDSYFYVATLLNNQFELRVEMINNKLKTEIIELATNFEYTLHLTNAVGEFVGKVRTAYENAISSIVSNCFEKDIFKTMQALEVMEYVRNVYGDELEYLWQKFPNNAIWRRSDNKKWYGAILTVPGNKLNFNTNEIIEILDLRADCDEINDLIDNKTIFEGYHMNKKHWITICLNNSIPTEKLFELIDKSYNLAKKK